LLHTFWPNDGYIVVSIDKGKNRNQIFLKEGLEYKRIGPLAVVGFPEVIDRYVFTLNGKADSSF
jgi:hypothetical protein